MEKTIKGATSHDAWTCAGVHYVGLFACCIRTVTVVEDGKKIQHDQPPIHLLSCAPIECARDLAEFESHHELEIATQFNAEKYAEHFERLFKNYYKLDIRKWAVAAISDNAAVSLKLVKFLGLEQIPYSNHLLNLDVKHWVKDAATLNNVLESIK